MHSLFFLTYRTPGLTGTTRSQDKIHNHSGFFAIWNSHIMQLQTMSYKWKSTDLVGRTSRQTIVFLIKRRGGRGGGGERGRGERGTGSTDTCLLPFNFLSNWNVLINGMSRDIYSSHLWAWESKPWIKWTKVRRRFKLNFLFLHFCFVEINSYLIMLLWSTWSWKPILTHGMIVPLCVILSFFQI